MALWLPPQAGPYAAALPTRTPRGLALGMRLALALRVRLAPVLEVRLRLALAQTPAKAEMRK
jgi:hypothetical protein